MPLYIQFDVINWKELAKMDCYDGEEETRKVFQRTREEGKRMKKNRLHKVAAVADITDMIC